MARQAITSYNITDDLSHVVEAPKIDGEKGARLNSNGAVRITVTDRDDVWVLDTARRNVLVSLLKDAGERQKKRGRKAGSTNAETTPEGQTEGETPEAA